ncbi:MAG: BatA domain-containing protein [Bacteroidetes bacterium]|nr:BatA domain-containing protein [Bacteroidota bacterium]
MSFVYPEFLWGLLLLTVPIILHLYNFRKYKILYFSSLQFIKKVDQESRKTRNIKHILVLISRCLFMTFLIVAFAQPFIPLSLKGEKGGKTLVAIYLDNSFSMGQKGAEGELLSEAKETAKRIVLESSNESRILLTTNDLDGSQQRIISKAEAIDRLDKIQLSPIVKNLEEQLTWIRNFAFKYDREEEKLSNVQTILLSDFQKVTTKFKNKVNDSLSSYFPIQFIPQNPGNLSIDSIWFTNPNIRLLESNELNIRLRNYSSDAVKNVEIHVEIGNINRDFFVDIPPNQSTTTQITYTEQSSKANSDKTGLVSVLDKQMFFDDVLYFSYRPKTNCQVLIINGPDAVTNVKQVFEQDLFYAIREVSSESLTMDVLNESSFVVINGVNTITNATANDLKDFSQQRGSVFVFPGKQADQGGLNGLLSKLGLPSILGTTKDGTKIKSLVYEDPFFQPMFDRKPQNLNLPSLTLQFQGNGSTAIALMKAQNGKNILSAALDRKSYLFHSNLQAEFSNFTNNALFSAILLRSGELSGINKPLFITIGGSDKYPIEKTNNSDQPYKLKKDNFEFVPLRQSIGFIDYISFEKSDLIQSLQAGQYQLFNENLTGNISLNYNRFESDISTVKLEDLELAMIDKGYKNIQTLALKDGQSKVKIDLNEPASLWKWFILLAVLFFVTEMALIKFLKN